MLDVQAMKSLSQQITQVMPWVQGITVYSFKAGSVRY
jgi:hypothetical protein